jgi:hypothetical protein
MSKFSLKLEEKIKSIDSINVISLLLSTFYNCYLFEVSEEKNLMNNQLGKILNNPNEDLLF